MFFAEPFAASRSFSWIFFCTDLPTRKLAIPTKPTTIIAMIARIIPAILMASPPNHHKMIISKPIIRCYLIIDTTLILMFVGISVNHLIKELLINCI
jgi:hypothetical protein